MEFIRQAGFILLVLGLLAAAISILGKRRRNLRWPVLGRAARRVEVLERVSLSAQASLALVRLDEREILIAISGSACTVIKENQRAKGVAA